MKRLLKISAATTALLIMSAHAQQTYTPAQRQVLAPVTAFFEAMSKHDVEASRRLMLPGASLVAVRSDGSVVMQRDADYLDSLTKDKVALLERIWDAQVTVSDNIAQVWAPYDFHLDGKFSHCGIDVFNLVRTAEGWRIAGISYSGRKTGCAPSPLDNK